MVVYILQVVDHTFCIAEASVYRSFKAARNAALERISELKDSDSNVEIIDETFEFHATIDTTKMSIYPVQI